MLKICWNYKFAFEEPFKVRNLRSGLASTWKLLHNKKTNYVWMHWKHIFFISLDFSSLQNQLYDVYFFLSFLLFKIFNLTKKLTLRKSIRCTYFWETKQKNDKKNNLGNFKNFNLCFNANLTLDFNGKMIKEYILLISFTRIFTFIFHRICDWIFDQVEHQILHIFIANLLNFNQKVSSGMKTVKYSKGSN